MDEQKCLSCRPPLPRRKTNIPAHPVVPSTQSTRYSQLAANLPEPLNELPWQFGAQSRWRSRSYAVVSACADLDQETEECYFERGRIVPDGWCISPERQTLCMLEIVEGNDISKRKADEFVDFAWVLDEIYWQLRIVCFYPRMMNVVIIDPWMPYAEDFNSARKPFSEHDKKFFAGGCWIAGPAYTKKLKADTQRIYERIGMIPDGDEEWV